MKVVTFVYHETEGTRKMAESCRRFHNLDVLKVSGHVPDHALAVYEWFLNCEDEYFCYSDAADTFFQRPLNVPKDYLLWSTEKACFPRPELASQHPETTSRWKYLNNGIYCGPTKLIQEYYKKYELYDVRHMNGQEKNMRAFLQATQDGFPVKLDQNCDELQSIAFLEPDDFEIIDGFVVNKQNKTCAAIIHNNGGHNTPMDWVFNLWPEGRIK